MTRAAIATLAFAAEVLARDGALWSVVRTASMTPALRPGDRVLTVPPGTAWHVGDVLAVADDDRVLVHRLIGVVAAGLVLKGDALGEPDSPIAPRAVIGRVVAVARRGRTRALDGRCASALGRAVAWYSRAVVPRAVARGRLARLFRLPLHVAAAWRW